MKKLTIFEIQKMPQAKEPQEILNILRKFRSEAARLQSYLDEMTTACELELSKQRVT